MTGLFNGWITKSKPLNEAKAEEPKSRYGLPDDVEDQDDNTQEVGTDQYKPASQEEEKGTDDYKSESNQTQTAEQGTDSYKSETNKQNDKQSEEKGTDNYQSDTDAEPTQTDGTNAPDEKSADGADGQKSSDNTTDSDEQGTDNYISPEDNVSNPDAGSDIQSTTDSQIKNDSENVPEMKILSNLSDTEYQLCNIRCMDNFKELIKEVRSTIENTIEDVTVKNARQAQAISAVHNNLSDMVDDMKNYILFKFSKVYEENVSTYITYLKRYQIAMQIVKLVVDENSDPMKIKENSKLQNNA